MLMCGWGKAEREYVEVGEEERGGFVWMKGADMLGWGEDVSIGGKKLQRNCFRPKFFQAT